MSHPIRIAILDMYNGEPNQGMRCIIDIVNRFNQIVTFQIFDVRGKSEFPDIQKYDIFISTGGPGNPLEGDGWDLKWYDFVDQLWHWNKEQKVKKHMLFICHSFQMACHHFGLATINKRKATSFGVMTIHKTEAGTNDPVLEGLNNPFYAIDSRDYQVVQPKLSIFSKKGAMIIALEKMRTHVEYERAIMGVRFSDEFVGLQFHPEADALSFVANLKNKERREHIIAMKGKTKFRDMLEDLLDEDKIYKTNETIIPNFLRIAINDLMKHRKSLSN
ncbi:type 1 glutamine amidotransferase [Flavobacterium sp. 102]|uniref:type 1 glutamine amidotransferase n=1 Tax=Flavobacterium sp. 102 TaxID=2135623 RepID=UPI000EAFBCE3|nr:GMP synthase [Flavobacterium sp. 102]RKS02612.1 GMP synthase-like glutamine amidotransferase [Flavobacterium sp. 102]